MSGMYLGWPSGCGVGFALYRSLGFRTELPLQSLLFTCLSAPTPGRAGVAGAKKLLSFPFSSTIHGFRAAETCV